MTTKNGRALIMVASTLALTIAPLCCGFSSLSASGQTSAVAVFNVQSALKGIRNASARIKRSAVLVVNDVAQRKLAVETGDPRYIEPSDAQIEKNSRLWAQELAQLGPLEPPKKSWIDADMTHLKHWIDILNEDIKAMPSDQVTVMGPSWTEMTTLADNINKNFDRLQTLSAGPTYDNLAIASAALAIRDDVKKLDKPWQAAMKCVRVVKVKK